jgi:hypothetical protein
MFSYHGLTLSSLARARRIDAECHFVEISPPGKHQHLNLEACTFRLIKQVLPVYSASSNLDARQNLIECNSIVQ